MRFLRRFEQFGGEDDLQNAISELDNSVSFTADSDPIKPHRLCLLCQALKHRFLLLSNRGDIDRAIKLGHDAVTLAEGDRDNFQSCLLILLSDFYSCRYEILENLDDLNSAVSAAELAVSASAEGHPRKAHALVVLIGCLNRRFEQLPGLNDIESVIEKGRLAFSLVEEDELKSQVLENIAHPLAHRFMHLGKSDDLEESISAMKKAIDLMPKSSPYSSDKVGFLSFLLAKRFVLFDNPADLEEAIIKGTDAMNVMSSTDPNWPRILDTLSGCFYERFQLNGDLNDLTESISLLQSSLSESSIPDESFSKPVLLHRLGGHLRCRFLETKDANDIDEAVSAGRHAVECTPDGDTEKPSQLHYLIASLQTRFRYRKNIDDLEESITCGGKALSLVPSDDPNHPSLYHTILAQLRISRGLRSDRFKNISDTEEATSLCNSFDLSPIALPSARLNATLHQAEAHIDADCPNALKAYEAALNLLPRVAWTGKSIAARHRKLVRYGSIVNGAAAYTIQLGYANTALKWLETGPAIVWGQLHNLHSRVDDLSDAHPHFAERLSQLAFALEKATSQDVDSEDFKGLTIEEIARKHHHLASEWDSLVETVRVLPGFEDFLGPKRFSMFKKAAKLGPVILINISPTRCDALILTPDLEDAGIHIPLKDFTYDNAKNLQEQLTKALSALGVRTRASQPVHATSEKNVFMKVLKVLWTCIVKPVLDGLDFSPCDSTNLPRLWWCPTGPLAFLPIHAAGDYHTNERGTKLSDYVISSYTPTLTILSDKLEKTRTFKGLLAISQSNTPGMPNLPGTDEELQKIKEQVTKVPVKCLRGEEATPDTVLQGMTTCSWVHMACHATQEKAKSLDSTFHLHPSPSYPDGRLPLSHVIGKSFPDADFAYLSACQTATGDESLSEESVHLAAGMLMAGYRGVVATLWSIRDADAPRVADKVYSQLFEDGKPDSGQAAIALHHAVQSLRRDVENECDSLGDSEFVRWVPFIHVGV
ncbi:CHAT domain-containing protein [Armillaria luteobubalina]|uniref:CHAT domain-containing protein n=1 Tax=Armillaria luteobubalina TaxID=153913 RepID=A0AA39Q0E8_9AGAR|nr:CHAT domain-containing protein [Armillaria luteobubalina]